MQTTRLIVAMLAILVAAPGADAARFPGEWSNAFTGQTGRHRFVGRLDAPGGIVSGRIRGRRSPVRGRLQLSCGPLVAESRVCSGVSARGCAVEGYAYRTVFEGTYDCGGNPVGAVSFGRR